MATRSQPRLEPGRNKHLRLQVSKRAYRRFCAEAQRQGLPAVTLASLVLMDYARKPRVIEYEPMSRIDDEE